MEAVLAQVRELVTRLREQPLAAGFTLGDVATTLVAISVALWVLRTVIGLVSSVISSVTRRSVRSYGKWAVVTGATDGIGKAYAKALARKGMNIVLISRSEERLAETAAELRSKNAGIEVRTVAADFSMSATDAGYDRIAASLSDLDVGVLINNVGVSYPSALYFHELSSYAPTLVSDMINLNIVSVTRMTQIVLPAMVRARRGAIINVASAAGRVPIGNPMYAEYSGSKAYVDFFSRSLHHELAQFGVHVQCHSPYFVTTKLSKIRHTSVSTPTPDAYAAAAVAAIGGDASVVPYWAHAVQDAILRAAPESLLSWYLNWLHKGIRRAYLRKLEKAKKEDATQDAAPAAAAAAAPADDSAGAAPKSASSRGKRATRE